MNDEKNINADIRFERKDVNASVLAWIGAGIVVTAIILHVVLYGLYRMFDTGAARVGRIPATRMKAQPRTAVEPQLQVNPVADMKQLREMENRKLSSYGWVNKEQGVVRIPVEQAMKLIAERGLPKTNGEVQATNNAPPTPGAQPAQNRK